MQAINGQIPQSLLSRAKDSRGETITYFEDLFRGFLKATDNLDATSFHGKDGRVQYLDV